MWAQVARLVPPAPSHAKGGRPRMLDRPAFEAMIYVLHTGIQRSILFPPVFPSRTPRQSEAEPR